ncbi:hypothetical protein GXW82_10845 [Streptacidiphilus sp. 4-A2]|nr:hypothetical protein [Streptacidiphilus sp. 4-A2]
MPTPLLPGRRPAPAPRPAVFADRVYQVELDLGLDLDPDTAVAAALAERYGEQLTIEVADGPPVAERTHGMTGDLDLADQVAAAEAAAHTEAALQMLAAAEAASGRRRRAAPRPLCPGIGSGDEDRCAEAAGQGRYRAREGGFRTGTGHRPGGAARQAVAPVGRRQGEGRPAAPGSESAVRLRDGAADHPQGPARADRAPSAQRRGPGRRRRHDGGGGGEAGAQRRRGGARVGETVEAALLAQSLTGQEIADHSAVAVAQDVAGARGEQDTGAAADRVLMEQARGAVERLRAEVDLRVRMTAG